MAASGKFNLRNPAVKRIMQEIREVQQESSSDFIADALEDDIFEWHFVVRGPPDTEFEGGVYHGRILLPADYPFKPPSFMMLTPNGRFQTGVKICLSISSHHPEHWQPSWSVRTALMALIAFMPTPGQGALGSVDFTKEERQALALKSRTDPPKFGSPARQTVIDEMHQRMLQLMQQHQASSSSSSPKPAGAAPSEATPSAAAAAGSLAGARQFSDDVGSRQQEQQQQQTSAGSAAAGAKEVAAVGSDLGQSDQSLKGSAREGVSQQQWSSSSAAAAAAGPVETRASAAAAAGSPGPAYTETPADKGLTFLASVLVVAIVALLFKKFANAWGWQLTGVMES